MQGRNWREGGLVEVSRACFYILKKSAMIFGEKYCAPMRVSFPI